MDTEIRKGNMIPGSCDEFTRPEEIKALNKFLKQGRESLDNSIALNQNNLEVRGRRFIENPDKLPDNLEVLNPNSTQISSLVSSKEWLDSDKDLTLLEKNKEKLSVDNNLSTLISSREDLGVASDRDILTLPRTSESLGGSVTENVLHNLVERIKRGETIDSSNVSKLGSQESSEDLKKLEINRINLPKTENLHKGLSTEKLNLIDKRKNTLPSDREHLLTDNDLDLLENYKSEISIKDEISSLEGKKESITTEQISELPSTKEGIGGLTKNNELSNHREALEGREEKNTKLNNTLLKDTSLISELGKDKLLIKGGKNNNLSENIEKLKKLDNNNPEEEIDLDTEISFLSNVSDDIELEDNIEKLREDINTELSNYSERLSPIEKEIAELENQLEKLSIGTTGTDLGTASISISDVGEEITEITTLDKNLITPSIKFGDEIEKLGDSLKETINITSTVDELTNEDSRIKLEDVIRVNSLGNYIDSFSNNRENELEDYKDNISDDRENELENHIDFFSDSRENTLEDYKDNISDSRENTLEDYKDNISDSRENTLEDYKDNISDNRENTLEDYRDSISDNRENTLEDYRDNISDNRENTLEDYRDNISDNRENTLEDYRDNISDNRENTLEDYRDNISDNRENTLEDYRDSISDNRENTLEDYRDNISDNRENTLEDYRDSISDNRENTLEDYRDSISDNRENTLEDYKDNISDNRENTLEDYRDNISDNRENTLEDYRDNISDNRENTLEDYRDSISDNRENTLEDYRDSISDNRENTLEDYRDSISDNRENELEDYRDSISDNRENELEDYRDNISDNRENELEDYRDNISDNRENELEDYRDNISDNRENTLEDYIDSLSDSRENTLEDYRDNISDNRENELEDYRDNISDSRENTLEDYIDSLSDSRENELEDYRDNISDNRENELEDYRDNISDNRENELEDYRDNISDDRENTLEDYIDSFSDSRESKLEDHKESIKDNRSNTLSNYKDKISDSRENELEDYKDSIVPINVDDLSSNKEELISDDTTKDNHKQFDPESDGLYDSVIASPDDAATGSHKQFNPDTDKFNDEVESLVPSNHEKIESLNNNVIQVAEDSNDKIDINGSQHKRFNPEDDKLKETISEILATRDDLSLYYTNILKFAQSKRLGETGWAAKVSSLISAYLSSDKISQEKAEEFEKALYNTIIFEEPVITEPTTKPENISELGKEKKLLTLSSKVEKLSDSSEEMVSYKLPGFNLMGNGLNPSSYLRWAAENTVGKLAKGKLRALLLDEALGLLILGRDMLEKVTKSNRDRLPGDGGGILGDLVSGGLGNAVKGAISGVTGALLGGSSLDMSIPHNRPKDKDDNNIMPQDKDGKTTFEGLNNKGVGGKEEDVSLGKSLLKVAGGNIFGSSDVGNYVFKYRYLNGTGIETTLNELCIDTVASNVKSVEQLYQAIRQSPYISNSGKVTSYDYNTTKVRTLDSNCYWEIIFTPYAGEENGNVSYLPPINEINVWNNRFHGVNTGITTYIPVNSFELGKAKLTTKTLGLFDGEISYPVSMEFTNEFRLTFVDDQYKSWRTYFERCMDASIYNSTRHVKEDYKGTNWKKITAIDKKYNLGAPYKNVTFRCIIYSLTPQMSTISKYDLLLVLKDFVEERSGEIDGGANDLTVSFSIVGENPKEEIPKAAKLDVPNEKVNKDTSRTGMKSIISSGVSSVIGAFS